MHDGVVANHCTLIVDPNEGITGRSSTGSYVRHAMCLIVVAGVSVVSNVGLDDPEEGMPLLVLVIAALSSAARSSVILDAYLTDAWE